MALLLDRRTVDAYRRAIDSVARDAATAAMAAYDEMRRRDPNASIAEVRDGAIGIVSAVVESHGSAAGELAAEVYENVAASCGVDVRAAAVGLDAVGGEVIDASVRSAVGALVDEREDI